MRKINLSEEKIREIGEWLTENSFLANNYQQEKLLEDFGMWLWETSWDFEDKENFIISLANTIWRSSE
jgi:hypothetical protein